MSKTRARIIQTVSVLVLCALAFWIGVADFSSCFASCAGNQPSDRVSETRIMLGTYCTITIGDRGKANLVDEAFRLCERMESLFSMNIEGSDVWRINNAFGEAVQVDLLTIEVIRRGIEFGELSDGMFDITIGRLTGLWDITGEVGGNQGRREVPHEFEINDARRTVDFRQIKIDDAQSTVALENPRAWLDLGGIAKGYMADKLAEFLLENGVDSAIIDLGGDIVVIGSRPDGEPWRMGIQKPFSAESELTGIMEYSDASVVSSGIYERQFVQDGVRYHHILNPDTGMPAVSDIIAATIVSDSAATGEGLSTIAVLLGSERARELFDEAPGFIGAVLILDDDSIQTIGEVNLELVS